MLFSLSWHRCIVISLGNGSGPWSGQEINFSDGAFCYSFVHKLHKLMYADVSDRTRKKAQWHWERRRRWQGIYSDLLRNGIEYKSNWVTFDNLWDIEINWELPEVTLSETDKDIKRNTDTLFRRFNKEWIGKEYLLGFFKNRITYVADSTQGMRLLKWNVMHLSLEMAEVRNGKCKSIGLK